MPYYRLSCFWYQSRVDIKVNEIGWVDLIVRLKVIPYMLGLPCEVEVMLYYRWGCFLYQSRVVVRVKEFVRFKVIVRVEVIPYTLGLPIQVEVMLYSRWGCFLHQGRVVVRVKEFVKFKVIVRVKVIPYTLCFPILQKVHSSLFDFVSVSHMADLNRHKLQSWASNWVAWIYCWRGLLCFITGYLHCSLP